MVESSHPNRVVPLAWMEFTCNIFTNLFVLEIIVPIFSDFHLDMYIFRNHQQTFLRSRHLFEKTKGPKAQDLLYG